MFGGLRVKTFGMIIRCEIRAAGRKILRSRGRPFHTSTIAWPPPSRLHTGLVELG